MVYVWDYQQPVAADHFLLASILTAAGFTIIGILKWVVTQSSSRRGIAETLLLGIAAACVAFLVGD
jgi:vacuolar iron transporter family protein